MVDGLVRCGGREFHRSKLVHVQIPFGFTLSCSSLLPLSMQINGGVAISMAGRGSAALATFVLSFQICISTIIHFVDLKIRKSHALLLLTERCACCFGLHGGLEHGITLLSNQICLCKCMN
jgi:hypothetical protein